MVERPVAVKEVQGGMWDVALHDEAAQLGCPSTVDEEDRHGLLAGPPQLCLNVPLGCHCHHPVVHLVRFEQDLEDAGSADGVTVCCHQNEHCAAIML